MVFTQALNKILRTGEGKRLREYQKLVDAINLLEPSYSELPDSEFPKLTENLRERYWGESYETYRNFIEGKITFDNNGEEVKLKDSVPTVLHERTPIKPVNGESLDNLLIEAFALVREAAKRTLGLRHYDVQLLGGIALFNGNISEMKTGEGKTLVATAPAYLAAIAGLGVHIVTVNDYLASYQSELMGRVYRFLGMTTGCITANLTADKAKEMYNCDITYGTNNQFGFHYLYDNLSTNIKDVRQRAHYFAIVDEVDSILIDEARTPLIISGKADGDLRSHYADMASFVLTLTKATNIDRDTPEMLRRINGDIEPPNGDYEIDEKNRTVGVLETAIAKLEQHLGVSNLYGKDNVGLVQLYTPLLQNAIKAKELFLRDREYVVQHGEVKIVDEHTGRILEGRRYSEGLHQAIEAKEKVEIKEEDQTLASITLQNYFRLYSKLSGMTGTAETEAAEFQSTYNIGVIPIPTNKPMIRIDQTDLLFKNESGKFTAIVADVKERNEVGQPVLIGTVSVEKSEEISKALNRSGIKHNVLNAKQHDREAAVVAMAGRKGAVTVATNMAGRGTDIMLGGNSEFMAHEDMRGRGFDAAEDPSAYEKEWKKTLKKMQEKVAAEHDEVVELGGLYVLGTERHESRRIDNQLRGRSGRQGDPGESRFYLSIEDNLMRLFGGSRIQGVMEMLNVEDDVPIENKMLSNTVQKAQAKVEARNFEMRKNILKYDDVLTKQRKVIYSDRNRVLYGDDISDFMKVAIANSLHNRVMQNFGDTMPDNWNWQAFWEFVKELYPASFTYDKFSAGFEGLREVGDIIDKLTLDVETNYLFRHKTLSDDIYSAFERTILLYIVDRAWRQHLHDMDYLRNGIGLRQIAGKDPIVEYTNEASKGFMNMKDRIEHEVVDAVLRTSDEHILAASGIVLVNNSSITSESGPDSDLDSDNTRPTKKQAPIVKEKISAGNNPYKGTARNAPCPCGSGKKYKQCHGVND